MNDKTKKAVKGTGAIAVVTGMILTAIHFIGYKETPNNSGFQNKQFQQDMYNAGWRPGDSWCVDYAKLIWLKNIRNDTTRKLVMKLVCGNSQSTLANIEKDKSGKFIVSDSASVGAIVIWQEYKKGVAQWSGHGGFVDSVFHNRKYAWHDIEGNTNNNGSANGYIVLPKYHVYNWTQMNGLRTKKFISIKPKFL